MILLGMYGDEAVAVTRINLNHACSDGCYLVVI